jgi:hypothetical protein
MKEGGWADILWAVGQHRMRLSALPPSEEKLTELEELERRLRLDLTLPDSPMSHAYNQFGDLDFDDDFLSRECYERYKGDPEHHFVEDPDIDTTVRETPSERAICRTLKSVVWP